MSTETQNNQKNQDHEDYILKDNTKTKFGAGFIIVTLIILPVSYTHLTLPTNREV